MTNSVAFIIELAEDGDCKQNESIAGSGSHPTNLSMLEGSCVGDQYILQIFK